MIRNAFADEFGVRFFSQSALANGLGDLSSKSQDATSGALKGASWEMWQILSSDFHNCEWYFHDIFKKLFCVATVSSTGFSSPDILKLSIVES